MAISDKNITSPDFWSNMAAEAVYNSTEKRAKSVESLKTIIVWAFALFSAGGFMLTLFGSLKEYNEYALYSFGFAFFLLTISYMLANRAQYPVLQTLNTNIIEDIKTASSEINKTQANRFKWAAGITASGFFFLALGILLQFGLVKKSCKNKPGIAFLMKTGIEKRNDNTFIPVTVLAKENSIVALSFFDTGVKKDSFLKDTLLNTGIYYTDTTGNFYHSYTIGNKNIKNVRVKVTVTQPTDTLFEQTRVANLKIP